MTTAARDQQRTAALKKGNRIRDKRARTKRLIAKQPNRQASLRKVGELLLDPPPHLHRMTVSDLLRAAQYTGTVGARRILRSVSVSHTRTVGDLTERERRDLAARLGVAA